MTPSGPAARDRDDAGRARSNRPRDAEGRPLPHDAPASAHAEREPEDVVRTPAETLGRAQHLLDVGRPFPAHDVFEAAWKSGPPHERDLWQGLAQLCVGLTHLQRDNPSGAESLLARGAGRLRDFGATDADRHGVDVEALIAWADGAAHDVRIGQDVPPPPPLTTPR
jgi:hypothetical protein